ncbi:hypothetical protein [Piscibacillus halophilus]|uniref:hypothetical protein n=1 Tax=Piscibacillus halophilus TaxID=571933 RepID=UPI00158C17F6|nr:hypothetical protein [Piscibacillus halophilus]
MGNFKPLLLGILSPLVTIIDVLYEEEQNHFIELPENDYPVFKEKWVRANKYGEVMIDQVKVHIPKSYNFGQIRLVLYWDSFKVVSPNGE